MNVRRVETRRQQTKLKFPLKVGCKETGFILAFEGDTGNHLYRWDEEKGMLIISAEQSPVGQHRALLQALLEWTLYHLEGKEIIEHQLIQHEIDEVANLLLEMLVKAGVHVAEHGQFMQDRRTPQFEYKKVLFGADTKPTRDYKRRGKRWSKDPSLIAQRERQKK